MYQHVSVTNVSRHFSDFLSRVAYKGEYFILSRGKKALAELKPVPRGKFLGELASIVKLLPPLTSQDTINFAKDTTKTKKQLAKHQLNNPWALS